jgi:predicted ribosome quality control (RQC) complex YloA/Tae2 family protein
VEGLLLAEAVRPLEGALPLSRGGWRFPDARTAVLPLQSGEGGRAQALWIFSRPPTPRLGLRDEVPAGGSPHTPFQEQLVARAAGPVTAVRQQALDRVVELSFGESEGFVPQPPVTLVAELTGRNANLVLLDVGRVILGVERVVLAERNRYRELRPGLAYRPPPPYRKLDPRTASMEALAEALSGARLRDVRSRVDGIGPQLAKALAAGTGLEAGARLEGETLRRVVGAVQELAARPSAWLERAGGFAGLAEERQRDRRERATAVVREVLRRRLELAERRLEDASRAQRRAVEAVSLREEADLLMAYPSTVSQGARRVSLTAFDGSERTLDLDPSLDVFGNARKRYDRARRLEERAERAARERPQLERERFEAERELAGLSELDVEELERRAKALSEDRRQHRRRGPGVRFRDPHGFEVVVGRNARENEAVTFAVGRSRDLWLHVQGLTGAHVIVRAESREVPFETVLFAARLAAGFSPARQSDNVAVDYTQRKNVWKVKGQPPGTVHFSHQKTVFVTPARDAVAAAGASRRGAGGGGTVPGR